jgi:hypothetical protein
MPDPSSSAPSRCLGVQLITLKVLWAAPHLRDTVPPLVSTADSLLHLYGLLYALSPHNPFRLLHAMSVKHRHAANDYELLPRDSLDDEAKDYTELRAPSASWISRVASTLRITNFSNRALYAHYVTPRRRKRSVLRLVYWTIFSIPYFLVLLVLVAGIFFPSYTVRPAHYNELRQRALDTTEPGRANPYKENVFIAAALYEEKGNLASGAWGKAVLQLIDLLGPEHVHLSIYEDNPDLKTKQALVEFREKVPGKPRPPPAPLQC